MRVALLLVWFQSSFGYDCDHEPFLSFVNTYHKDYSTYEEFMDRFTIFKTNLQKIQEHNLDTTKSFKLEVNKFSDLTTSEFKQMYTGLENLGKDCVPFVPDNTSLPSAVDWRNKSVVNQVKDQGQCGSCWAFATVANAESIWAIDTGVLFDLSEQEVVDCSRWNRGCNGGNPDTSFKYMIQHGLTQSKDYPYTSGNTHLENKCQPYTSVVSFSTCYDITPNDQLALTHAVNLNPVVIAVEADTYFQSYSSGIITSIDCGTNLDHAVEIVGYGTDQGIDYWLIRNSWGEDWGEGGYVRVLRTNSTQDMGICGVAAQPSFLQV
jgi:C1A family cysteine protease